MTISTLVLSVAAVALLLTLLIGFTTKRIENWVISLLQNFCAVLFIFSGWVKAVDPLGTAYKMEQYFAEFESTFSGTWFSFLAPMFPQLSEWSIGFSVFMVVFEIVLGIMLLIGSARKFTAWAFFLLVAFFTVLTGFTYLTGYVPAGVNFFQFGQWGPYVETNMKVTDCGCFGDFIKLAPFTSFMKDVFLLVPSIIFLIYHNKMHQLMGAGARTAVVILGTAALILYSFSNYMWDLPHTDFRPFHNEANIRLEKELEDLAENNAEVIAYKVTNKETGETAQFPINEYLQKYKEYPKEQWELEQIKADPVVKVVKNADGFGIPSAEGEAFEAELASYLAQEWEVAGDTTAQVVERSKISDFELSGGPNGTDVTYDILNNPEYSFMVVAYKLYTEKEEVTTKMLRDTIYRVDTVAVEDTIKLVRSVDRIDKRQVEETIYHFGKDYLEPWTDVVNPVLAAAQKDGFKVFAATSYASPEKLEQFQQASESSYPFYTGDDILLKTIVRSNPGVVLLKNGKIIDKWHYKKLPAYQDLKTGSMQ
ncbi:MAG: DoxX family protein [Phaeodactylibacter sp.]|nr:DoxX family protein [Phaeodactylibacter sp.]